MAINNKKKTMSPQTAKDLDNDGIITDREVELEIKLEKAETQTGIARWALFAMIMMASYLVSPYGPAVDRLTALDSTLATFFVAMASIVGAYMGFTAWMSRK